MLVARYKSGYYFGLPPPKNAKLLKTPNIPKNRYPGVFDYGESESEVGFGEFGLYTLMDQRLDHRKASGSKSIDR